MSIAPHHCPLARSQRFVPLTVPKATVLAFVPLVRLDAFRLVKPEPFPLATPLLDTMNDPAPAVVSTWNTTACLATFVTCRLATGEIVPMPTLPSHRTANRFVSFELTAFSANEDESAPLPLSFILTPVSPLIPALIRPPNSVAAKYSPTYSVVDPLPSNARVPFRYTRAFAPERLMPELGA